MSGYVMDHRSSLKRIARHDDQDCSKESILNMMDRFVKTVSVMDDTILIPSRLMDREIGDATDNMPMPGKGGVTNSSSSSKTSSSSSSHSHHHHHHHHRDHHHKKKASVQESLNAASLYTVYTMLNKMKTDLLWGRNQDMIDEAALDALTPTPAAVKVPDVAPTAAPAVVSASATVAVAKPEEGKQDVKGHIRRPSTASMASSNSSTGSSISDGDSESEISNENDSGIESENNHQADKSEELAKQFRTHLNGLYRTLEQMTEAANYLTARYQSDVGQV